MDMRKWEILGILGVVGVLVALPVAVFGYQSYREAQAGHSGRPPSVAVPQGDLVAGRQVYLGKCAACHGQKGEGAPAGPDIRRTGVAGSLFIYSWIMDPGTVTTFATMPKVPLTDKELADVTEYVMGLLKGKTLEEVTLPQEAPLAVPATGKAEVTPTGGDVSKGKTVYGAKGCAACHGPNGEGTAAALGLKGFPAEKVKGQVRAPTGKMPPFGPSQVSDDELEDLAAFIGSLR